MRVLIVGAQGNMGTRYRLILRALGVDQLGIDKGDDWPSADQYDRVIIATPTETHTNMLWRVPRTKAVLVEKPICKDLQQLAHLLDTYPNDLRMVDNYRHLDSYSDQPGIPVTEYNYFKHGNDGLYWDCIQLLRYARGPVFLREDSPVFKLTLNGIDIPIGEFDHSYVRMLRDWIYSTSPNDRREELERCHKRAAAMEAACVR